MKTKNITRIGILSAFTLLLLILSCYIRTNSLSFLVMASFMTGIAYLYTDIKSTIYYYIIVCILGFIIIPDKSIIITYALLFGMYGLVKLFIERLRKKQLEILLKNLYAIVSFYIIYIFIGNALLNIDSVVSQYEIPKILIYITLIALFNLYDYLYTAVILFVNKKIKRNS